MRRLAALLGLWCFASGFFLTRVETTTRSQCAALPDGSPAWPGSPTDGCWAPRPFEQVVLVVVDALRYEVALEELPALRQTPPTSSALLRLRADPPTVTMQRLKALTTGSLPTFIDVKDNFASPAVEEDSWVSQALALGRRAAFVGDDTWAALFPALPGLPQPSFNVRDLDSNDAAVGAHVERLMAGEELVVAHLLGVDHAGHTFGPAHPEMARKLADTDALLARVLRAARPGALVLVLGDHGMTADGNHGGASPEETGAALFVHAPGRELGALPAEASQLDVVPTVALALGLPIPFANLGTALTGALGVGLGGALEVNRLQVERLGLGGLEAAVEEARARYTAFDLRLMGLGLLALGGAALYADAPPPAAALVWSLHALSNSYIEAAPAGAHLFSAAAALALLEWPAGAAWALASRLAPCASAVPDAVAFVALGAVLRAPTALLAALWAWTGAPWAARLVYVGALWRPRECGLPVAVALLTGAPWAVVALAVQRAVLSRSGSGSGSTGAGALMWLAGEAAFFHAGHHTAFSSVQYTAPFIGFEDFAMWRAAPMQFLHAFGPAVLAAAWSPARAETLRCAVLGVFVAALSAGLQRRHLMVWAVFAPKLLFQGGMCVGSVLGSCL